MKKTLEDLSLSDLKALYDILYFKTTHRHWLFPRKGDEEKLLTAILNEFEKKITEIETE